MGGAITLLGHALTVPSKNGVGLDERGHCQQGVLPQRLTDCGERRACAIRQPDAPCDLVAQETMLRHEGLVAQQQCLIDGPRDRGQQMCPVHCLSPAAVIVHIADESP